MLRDTQPVVRSRLRGYHPSVVKARRSRKAERVSDRQDVAPSAFAASGPGRDDSSHLTTDPFGDFDELKSGILRTILIRRITLAIFSVVAWIVVLVTRISWLNPLPYAPLVWFLLTFPFQRFIERQRTLRALHLAHTLFFIAEVVLITVLVHLMGGSEWIGSIFYLFTVIYANFFLPRTHGAIVTGLVVAAYAGLIMLEYAGFIPHRSLFQPYGQLHENLSYNLATLLAGPVSIYAIVAFTVRTFAAVYARKNRMLTAREQQLAKLSKRLLSAHDDERRRIARGLHDDLIQSLAAIKLRLAPTRARLGNEAYQEICSIVDGAIAETRTLAYSVRPPLLDDLGLLPSLRRLADSVENENGLRIRVQSELDESLDIAVESLLFYVARECLQNAVRYARASDVAISLSAQDGFARLSIRDDGVGFRPGDSEGFGLRGVRERVHICGGVLSIDSAPGRGTAITVEVPSREDASDSR